MTSTVCPVLTSVLSSNAGTLGGQSREQKVHRHAVRLAQGGVERLPSRVVSRRLRRERQGRTHLVEHIGLKLRRLRAPPAAALCSAARARSTCVHACLAKVLRPRLAQPVKRRRKPGRARPSPRSRGRVGLFVEPTRGIVKEEPVTASARSKVSQSSSSPASTRARDTCWRATIVRRRTGASVTEPNESVAEISSGSSTPPTPARSMASLNSPAPSAAAGRPS